MDTCYHIIAPPASSPCLCCLHHGPIHMAGTLQEPGSRPPPPKKRSPKEKASPQCRQCPHCLAVPSPTDNINAARSCKFCAVPFYVSCRMCADNGDNAKAIPLGALLMGYGLARRREGKEWCWKDEHIRQELQSAADPIQRRLRAARRKSLQRLPVHSYTLHGYGILLDHDTSEDPPLTISSWDIDRSDGEPPTLLHDDDVRRLLLDPLKFTCEGRKIVTAILPGGVPQQFVVLRQHQPSPIPPPQPLPAVPPPPLPPLPAFSATSSHSFTRHGHSV